MLYYWNVFSPVVNKEGGGLNKLFKSPFLSWEEINRLVTTELLFWLKVNFHLTVSFLSSPSSNSFILFCLISAWMDQQKQINLNFSNWSFPNFSILYINVLEDWSPPPLVYMLVISGNGFKNGFPYGRIVLDNRVTSDWNLFLEIRGFRMVFLGGVDIFFLKGSTELTHKWGAD